MFPDNLKIPKTTLIYKAGDNTDISHYRSILGLPCFSKILKLSIYITLQVFKRKPGKSL